MSKKEKRPIKFVCNAVTWFDKANGNTYHSVKVTRCKDGAIVTHNLTYGYSDCYKQTALETLQAVGWLGRKYTSKTTYRYERENNYPISWHVSEGTKVECDANAEL